MSDFKNKLLEISGEISREDEITNLSEDHKIISRNSRLETRMHEAFSKIISEIESFEYSLGGYSALPYGRVNPEKVIEQAKNNQYMYKKLKKIAYKKMLELKQVIDEVLCPEEEEGEKEIEVEISTSNTETPGFEMETPSTEMETEVQPSNNVKSYLSKKTDMKKKKY